MEFDDVFAKDCGEEALGLGVLAEVDCTPDDATLVGSLELQGDYVGRRLTTNVSVPGNIHKSQFRDFWMHNLECSQLVKDTISDGYQLPFQEIPPDCFEANNK